MSQALVEMAHVDASEDEQSELDELERLKSSPLRVSGICLLYTSDAADE